MKTVTKFSRRIIGIFVVLIGWLTRPVQIKRNKQEQRSLDKEAQTLRLYDYKGCPSSMAMQKVIHHLNVDIPVCDIRTCQIHQDNLLAQFGRLQAPCLRIENKDKKVQWLDEPSKIIHYLNQRFDTQEHQLHT